MKSLLRKQLDGVVKKLYGKIDIACSFEIPPGKDFGDFSTNAAFLLSKDLKKSPLDIAREISVELAKKKIFSRVEVAGPGFINLFVEADVLVEELKRAEENGFSPAKTKSPALPKLRGARKEKIQLEFISANPTGPLTLGNGRGGFSGDTLASVLKKSGNTVEREYYINDAGRQVKEALTKSIKKASGLSVKVEEGEDLYGGYYVEEVAGEIKKKKGLDWIEKNWAEVGVLSANIILKQYIKKDIASFGIKYDSWQSEQEFFDSKLIEKMWKFITSKRLVYEKDGAEWLKTSEYGDEKDRVVMTTDGKFTYLMSDIAYLYDRFAIRKFDRVIVIVGADHHGYIDRWKAAAEMLGFAGRLEVIVTQLVRLIQNGQEVRMSKRKGNFITLKEVVDDIGIEAARYFFISRDFNTHMDIDVDLAKEKSNKNPIFYIQYANARIMSILEKIKQPKKKDKKPLRDDFDNSAEIELIKKLLIFPDLVGEIAESYEVHKLTTYAYELAGLFHRFYETCNIIGSPKEKDRIKLIKTTGKVFKECLGLMGIEPAKKM